jgi:(2Fe-2S) ferredoxin
MIVRHLRQQQVILVCSESDCKKNGCKKVCAALKAEVQAQGLKGEIRVQKTKCLGHCKHGPNVMVYPASILYSGVRKSDAQQIVADAANLGTAFPKKAIKRAAV